MKKTLLIYGLFLGILAFVLKFTEYWFWIKLNTFDVYAFMIAAIFLVAGIWLGIQLQQQNKHKNALNSSFTEGVSPNHEEPKNIENQPTIQTLNISKREQEVLILLGKGMSNQEIADTLFVSQNTIKTHTSRLFEKLDVRNRTHAILKAKELGLLSP